MHVVCVFEARVLSLGEAMGIGRRSEIRTRKIKTGVTRRPTQRSISEMRFARGFLSGFVHGLDGKSNRQLIAIWHTKNVDLKHTCGTKEHKNGNQNIANNILEH